MECHIFGLKNNPLTLYLKDLVKYYFMFGLLIFLVLAISGVGSGMSLKMKSGQSFNLTVLYSATKSEREQNQNQDRMQLNRLVIHPKNVVQMEAQEETYELTHSVRDLCRTLDAFIFIIDASTNAEAGEDK